MVWLDILSAVINTFLLQKIPESRVFKHKVQCTLKINSQLAATIIILLIISIISTCFGRKFRPSSGALDCVYSLWYKAPKKWPAVDQDEVELVPPHPGHQQAASSVLYTTSCKHSLVLLRMGEIIARNILNWLKLLIKFLLHLVGCLCYCINDARSNKHHIYNVPI